MPSDLERRVRTLEHASKLVLVTLVMSFSAACGHATAPAPSAPPEPPPPAAAPAPEPAAAPAASVAPAPMAPESASPRARTEVFEREEPAEDRRAAPASSQPARDDLATAEAEFERARGELNQALAARAPRPAGGAGAPSAASRGAADAAPPAKAEKKSAETSCSTACRAFASLERAAAAVCRLTGEKDGRCSHAHAVVADAKKRLAVCVCTSE